jgi:hypothetical protein
MFINNLVYLVYGPDGKMDELVYSVLSALHTLGPETNNYRIIVYTDAADALGDLPVYIEPITNKLLAEWAGPFDFNHRRKILAIRNALEKFGSRLVYCDTDTYFLNHPDKMFSRIRPGHTFMHMCEGHLNNSNGAGLDEYLDKGELRTVTGQHWNITRDTLMFNAGVIGIHQADIGLLDEVLHLTDQIYPRVRIHTVEQFAFSACLNERTELQEAYDVICHYWPMPGRARFQEELRRVLHDPSISSQEERLRRLLPYQPSQSISHNRHIVTMRRRMHLAIRQAARRIGVVQALKWVIGGRASSIKGHIVPRANIRPSLGKKSNKLKRDG